MTLHRIALVVSLLLLAGILSASELRATEATPQNAKRVAANWSALIVDQTGAWAGSRAPRVVLRDSLASDDGCLLAYVLQCQPDGFIVVPVLKELPPVKLYAQKGRIDPSETGGLVQLVRERLHAQTELFREAFGSLAATPHKSGLGAFPAHHRETWERLLVSPAAWRAELAADKSPALRGTGPLLATSWHQHSPYNDLAPMGDGGRCLAGCVAIGTAQVMNYHQWPAYGFGEHTYWWSGDGPVGGDSLSADFSDAYDWSGTSTGLAEICYEVGVAYEMNYGHSASYASLSDAVEILPGFFRYDDSIAREDGDEYSSAAWFALIQSEIEADRPMPYSYPGHALACDGWRVWGSENQIHLNYGWGGTGNGWYAVDDIYGHSGNHTSEALIRNVLPDPAIIVNAAGTGDYPTIQAAIQAAAEGETIKLQDGVYRGPGNRDISFLGKAVTVRSQSRDPRLCILDVQGSPLAPRRGLRFLSGEGPASRLEDLWIRGGWAEAGGAGIACYNASPTIEGCILAGNAAASGAAIGCYQANPLIRDCTLYANQGGAIAAGAAFPVIENTLITANSDTAAVVCFEGGEPQLLCSDIWGNPEGDWTACIIEQLGINGNLSADPLFCAPWDTVLTLSTPSPCLPANNPCGVVIGALGEGCSDYLVYPDGSGPFPTIQAAVDAAVNGGTIVLADGVFSGPGNWDVLVGNKSLTIQSFSQDAASCILDCADPTRSPHRAITFRGAAWPTSHLEDLTIRNGAQPDGSGGALLAVDGALVYVRECVLRGNQAARGGAAAADSSAELDLSLCELSANTAAEGGAVWARNAELALIRCTLAENVAELGSGIAISGGSLGMNQGLIAFGEPGAAVAGSGLTPQFDCSDVYGNAGGDWVGCLAGQEGIDGNIAADPLFCDPAGGDYTLAEGSPCLDLSDCIFEVGPAMGCYGQGCSPSHFAPPPPARPRLVLASSRPNPLQSPAVLSYTLPSAGHVRLTIYDPAGRRITTLVDGHAAAGSHTAVWKARDAAGRRVGAGVYFARLDFAGQGSCRRLVVVD